ncbi:MAG: hypothetical protein GF317_20945 [Candidatus Lokiarchaeota archaeon]|nr:hypothetical protein [Candidatus Lokiarchaeota archaeon]MBD3201913.1 hypothetical protein [Candidatus Lokiarchaeota archaeon]
MIKLLLTISNGIECPKCRLLSVVEVNGMKGGGTFTLGFWCLSCDAKWSVLASKKDHVESAQKNWKKI